MAKLINLSRRNFITLAGASLAASALSRGALAQQNVRGVQYALGSTQPWPNGVMQGATDSTSATIIITEPLSLEYTIEVRNAAGGSMPWRVATEFPMPSEGMKNTEIVVTGLQPGNVYTLLLAHTDGGYFDLRTFEALDISNRRQHIALVACADDEPRYNREMRSMWETLVREDPTLVVWNGDTCYADQDDGRRHTEEGYMRRYVQTRTRLAWFQFERLIPTVADWDDHDFGIDNGDRTFAGATFTRQLFPAFWGTQNNRAWQRTGFGVGSKLTLGGVRYYLMDNRSYRDPAHVAGGRHWGAEQTEWLLADIAQNNTPAMIVNPSQVWSNGRRGESMECRHPDDLAYIMGRLAQAEAPIAFAVGDVHYSDVGVFQAAGREYVQITSSCMHSKTIHGLGSLFGRPGQIACESNHNFVMLDSDTRNGQWNIATQCVTEDNIPSFHTTHTIA